MSGKQNPDSRGSTTHAQAPAEKFFGEGRQRRIRQQLEVTMSQHTYLPKLDSSRSDWVATAAIPAFRALDVSQGAVRSFCSIGTGVGLDALAAVEILGPSRVVVTDLHQDVVDCAAANIRRNLRDASAVEICAYAGELATPVQRAGMKFDLIYENLPNMPLALDQDLDAGQTSSTFFQATEKDRPAVVVKNLLELHFDLLSDVRRYLNEGGRVVSVIGGQGTLEAPSGDAYACWVRGAIVDLQLEDSERANRGAACVCDC